MSYIFEFLEAAGRGETAAAHGAGRLDGVPPAQRDAIAVGDAARLARLLGIAPIRAAYVTAPDNDPVPAESPADLPDDQPDESDQRNSEAA